ncbi:MAG: DUF3604 domain-containing protein [Cellvibrionaceae bacterium]|nr:DUF3604 domain-containing protein [Cellvibrionaceae bacterium]
MNKKVLIGLSGLALVAAGGYSYYQKQAGKILKLTPEKIAELKAEAAKQREQAFAQPAQQPKPASQANDNNNLYWGDLHVHTALSFDSYLFGNRLSLDDAYRFAMGETLYNIAGEPMQLQQPLDFVAITDHAESFGMLEACGQPELSPKQAEFCAGFDKPSVAQFLKLRKMGEARPPVRPTAQCNDDLAQCLAFANSTWRQTIDAAERYNKPGEFTAFAAYEYSPTLSKTGKLHRNVFFKNSHTSAQAYSAFDAPTVLDLWRKLEQSCQGLCEFLTIPHNMNKTWGLAYSGKTIDGDTYSKDDWALRERSEPLAEIFQIKGSSECAMGAGTSDEECNFELMVPVCEGEQEPGCSGPNSFVREGLKKGLQLQQELGFNPLQVGFVGSTDTHNSAPGDTEEWNSRGANGLYSATARTRLELKPGSEQQGQPRYNGNLMKNPGGLAAVWAKENTREAIFDAMQRRETYATSGSRIKLRFFAGPGLSAAIDTAADPIAAAYQNGVPMGSVLPQGKAAPEFFAWALADPASAKLQKIQIIKGWLEDGQSREATIDIACADGLAPEAGRCPNNDAKVDLSNCTPSPNKGASELKVSWQDPNYRPGQSAFYYVRVLQNPSCRWSTYDALRLGLAPNPHKPATIKERAWSSPIWLSPGQ